MVDEVTKPALPEQNRNMARGKEKQTLFTDEVNGVVASFGLTLAMIFLILPANHRNVNMDHIIEAIRKIHAHSVDLAKKA